MDSGGEETKTLRSDRDDVVLLLLLLPLLVSSPRHGGSYSEDLYTLDALFFIR